MATLKIEDDKLMTKSDMDWIYRLINMKISELSSTREGPTPSHAVQAAEQLRSLSIKVWALDASIQTRKPRR